MELNQTHSCMWRKTVPRINGALVSQESQAEGNVSAWSPRVQQYCVALFSESVPPMLHDIPELDPDHHILLGVTRVHR